MAQLNQPRVIAPEFRACYNGTGGAIAKGTIVKLKTSSPAQPGEIVAGAAATDTFYGVAANAIPNGEWGDVQVRGVALVLVGAAGLAAGQLQITSDGSGKAVAAASGNTLLGQGLYTGALVQDDLAEVELTPGGEAN
jgi:hypothetical protein